ncbi:LCP family protein required for cell wall assembly [Streptomyces umbrinus]|uniref:LCP family protein required for cell wall assembly n=1 Tax=Streptomyces umbrinus TaxID=67370 RepID=A0ABU0SYZ4_9ACTN|nr:LCP family protein [Streptomyces umbrinus]MDQ1028776.1 LCP family protein required for cell wall assembly [Streptomyces umbrinus]
MVQSSVRGEGTRPHDQSATREGGSHSGGAKEEGGDAGGGRHGRSTRRRGKHGILRWSAATLAVLILGTAGAGYLYYQHLNSNIRKGERASGDSKAEKAKPNAAGQTPLNILLIGSDSRNSTENVKLGGSRDQVGSKPLGDVQMLIHLSADRKSAAVVSIPRDTRVDIPKCTDPETDEQYPATNNIINASLGRGGAGCTLATWQNLTGVYIDHWMTIDFAGVVKMADAIGGVEVCVEHKMWDRPLPGVPGGSNLRLDAGKQKITGKKALQWLRTRHAFYSDLGRAKAQHMYMNSMIRTLKDQNVFTDGGRLMGLAEAATKSLKVSEELGSVKDLYDLGMQLKTVPTKRITMTTIPTVVDPLDPNHLVPAGADAEKLWTMVRDDIAFDKGGDPTKKKAEEQVSKDPAAADDEIGVTVRNGTQSATLGPVGGRASTIAGLLTQKGFTRATADRSAAVAEDKTVVRFPSAELEGDAQAVAKSLGIPLSSVKKSTDVSGVTLVVGADWRTGTAYPKQSAPKAGELPKDADVVSGSDSGACMPVYKPYRL